MLDALHAAGIRVVATRHEGAAAFAAEAYGQLTGRPAACLGTRAVGAANLAIGIHTATADSTPMFVLVGQVDRGVRGREAFQEVDLVGTIGRLAKWAGEIDDPATAAATLEAAVRATVEGRPGPALLALPEDVLHLPLPEGTRAPVVRAHPRRARPSPTSAPCSTCWPAAERPVILAGAGVLRARCSNDLVRLRRAAARPGDRRLAAGRRDPQRPRAVPGHGRLRQPRASSASGSGPPTRCWSSGRGWARSPRPGTRSRRPASAGCTWTSSRARPPSAARRRPSARSAPTRGRSCAPPSRGSRRRSSSPPPSPRATGTTAPTARPGRPRPRSRDRRGTAPASIRAGSSPSSAGCSPTTRSSPPTPGRSAAGPPAASGSADPGTFLGPTSGAMGYGFPAALAAALVHRERRVVALLGDGGMGMTLAEIETAVREGAHVVAIVFDNEQYGMIHAHQAREGSPASPGTDLGPIDFAAAARGLRGARRAGRHRRRRSSPRCGRRSPRPARRSSSSRWIAAGCRSTSPRRAERPHAAPDRCTSSRRRPGTRTTRPSRTCPAAYAEDGFVHCTDGDDEMVAVANRFYAADPRPFLLLTLDLERTGSPWRFDDPERRYPHVYGPIDPASVVEVRRMARTDDGPSRVPRRALIAEAGSSPCACRRGFGRLVGVDAPGDRGSA